jgi:hypothetical protein
MVPNGFSGCEESPNQSDNAAKLAFLLDLAKSSRH